MSALLNLFKQSLRRPKENITFQFIHMYAVTVTSDLDLSVMGSFRCPSKKRSRAVSSNHPNARAIEFVQSIDC